MKKLLFVLLLLHPLDGSSGGIACPDQLDHPNLQRFAALGENPAAFTPRTSAPFFRVTVFLLPAAMAADSIYIELQSADSTKTVPAKVTAIDYEANLALLAPRRRTGVSR